MTVDVDASASHGVILLYHRVTTATAPFRMAVTPSEFETQMQWVRTHCHPMPLDQLAIASIQGRLPARAVAVTLDDGYVDNLTSASPILAALGIPATFFVTTAFLNCAGEFWWDRLARVSTDESVLAAIHARLLPMSRHQRDEAIEEIASNAGPAATTSTRSMDAAEVRDLARRQGHAIGAHTVHHLLLPMQPADVQFAELAESRRALERATGRPVTAVAYPFGEAAPATLELAAAAGFRIGLGVSPPANLAGPMLLPRVDVTSLRQPLESWLEKRFRGPVQ